MRDKTFLIMAGGTGGHVFPALAVAQNLMTQKDKVVWMGSLGGMEESIVAKSGIPFYGLSVKGVRGKSLLKKLLAPFVVLSAVMQAISVIRQIKPNAVLGMGGFASGPGGLAAKIMGVPVIIHEQNSVAGLTNKILAKFAKTILTAFPKAFSENTPCKLVGNPLRAEITDLYYQPKATIEHGQINLLILGGSLGAQALNDTVPKALALIDAGLRPKVWHQTGKGKSESVGLEYAKYGIEAKVSDFIDDMAKAYQWASFAICRAGALTVSELCAAKIGAVLIPFPHAVDDHQTKNAQYLVEAGAAWLLPQSDLTPDLLAEVLTPLLKKPERLKILSEAATKLARVDATETVAHECRRVCSV